MSAYGRAIIVTLCACIVMLASGSINADPATDFSTPVDAILDAGWQSSFDGRRSLDQQVRELSLPLQADARIRWAHTLALLKQGRNSEAAKQVEAWSENDVQHLGLLRVQLWLRVLTKQYGEALSQMAMLGEALANLQPPPGKAEREDTIRMLGLLYGFLEGPAEDAVAVTQLAVCEKKLSAAIGPADQPLFESARQAVEQQYAALSGRSVQAEQTAAKQAEQDRERLRENATKQREQIDSDREGLAVRQSQLLEEWRSELEGLARQQQPLIEELARIERDLALLDSDLLRISDQVITLERLLRRERDPFLRDQILRDLDRLEFLARRNQSSRLEVERQAVVINGRLADVERQRVNLQTQISQEQRRMTRTLDLLERRQKQVLASERKADTLSGDRRRARALTSQATALTTYAPFPVEQEKQRLLDSL